MASAAMLEQMRRLIEEFAATSTEPSTLLQLLAALQEQGRWPSTKSVFDEARRKSRAGAQELVAAGPSNARE